MSDDDSVFLSACGNDDSAGNIPSSPTSAEFFYACAGHSLKALAILCQGLKNENGQPLVDPSALPWSAAKRQTDIKLTAIDLQKEVNRRAMAWEYSLGSSSKGMDYPLCNLVVGRESHH